MSFPSSDGHSVSPLTLQWNEFSDLLAGGSWDQACSQWSFDQLSEERRFALPSLARRFTDSRQFLFSEGVHPSSPLEVLWLQCRLFAGLGTQLLAFYQHHHRPHLGLEPSRIRVGFPNEADPLLPARWNFSVENLDGQDMAVPFVHENMPPAFQASLFQPPHSMDTNFKAPEIRDWPLGKKEEFTVLLRSMEKIRNQEDTSDGVMGIFQLHIMSDTLQGLSFSTQDVFRVQLPVPQKGNGFVTIWGTRMESSERGIVLRGQSERMTSVDWEQLEVAKDTAFSHAPVTFFRSFQHSCDWYSLGLLFFQTLLGRDAETQTRLEGCLPTMIRGATILNKRHGEQLSGKGMSPIRLLFDEQGTLFSSKRATNSPRSSGEELPEIPHYIWYATLELALGLAAREPVKGLTEEDALDPILQLNGFLHRIQQIGEWIRMELFSPHERRREILRACQIVRMEVGSIES